MLTVEFQDKNRCRPSADLTDEYDDQRSFDVGGHAGPGERPFHAWDDLGPIHRNGSVPAVAAPGGSSEVVYRLAGVLGPAGVCVFKHKVG